MKDIVHLIREFDWGVSTFINKLPHIYAIEELGIKVHEIVEAERILEVVNFLRRHERD